MIERLPGKRVAILITAETDDGEALLKFADDLRDGVSNDILNLSNFPLCFTRVSAEIEDVTIIFDDEEGVQDVEVN